MPYMLCYAHFVYILCKLRYSTVVFVFRMGRGLLRVLRYRRANGYFGGTYNNGFYKGVYNISHKKSDISYLFGTFAAFVVGGGKGVRIYPQAKKIPPLPRAYTRCGKGFRNKVVKEVFL